MSDAETPILVRIKAAMRDMAPAEQRVAAHLLADPERALAASMARIAAEAKVSEPTIMRFCRSLGYSGFKEFRLALARGLAGGVPFVHAAVSAQDQPSHAAQKVLSTAIAALTLLRDQLDPGRIEAAVDILAAARRIEFYGQGNSGIVAQDAQHKFFRLGYLTFASSDPHVHVMSASLLIQGDAVIVFSAGGRTMDLIQTMDVARATGAKVIAVTAAGSPLAKAADVAIVTPVFEDQAIYAPMLSRLAHLALVDALSVGVTLKRGATLISQLEKAKRTLASKRVVISRMGEAQEIDLPINPPIPGRKVGPDHA